ncbi:MAG: 50S ribosomal protein L11 methyltransferase [Streptosporangiaceae bacterium]|jgi:predicted nicotinamide N-methyase
MTPENLVRTATRPMPVPFVPEITLRTAADPYELWEQTGREPPPFWAFPWAGGQGLARYVLDHPGAVAGKTVLDVASGSGLVAIAAAKAGAGQVIATDIDPSALAVIALNADANNVTIGIGLLDLTAASPVTADVVLAADTFYDRGVAADTLAFARRARDGGAEVLISDPGRAFVPVEALTEIERYEVPVIKSLEDTGTKLVTVYRLDPRWGRPRSR